MNTFDLIKAKMEKASKGSRVMILSQSELAGEVCYMDTPTYDLNRILTGSVYKGPPSRTHMLIVGPEASGKSSFMCLNLAAAQRAGYTPVIIDAEGAWTPEFVRRWGIDPDRTIVIGTPWVEDILVELANMVDEGWTKMAIALDSIGALESKKIIRDGVDGEVKADQGQLQKQIKRILKMLVKITKYQDSITFSAGHYYGNPTGYGDPEQIGGGKYPRLAADIIATLKKFPIYEFPNAPSANKRGSIIGTRILAATIKNRYAPPFQEATFEISYTKGVDKMAGLVELGIKLGVIEKGGSWYKCPCLDFQTQGEVAFTEHLNSLEDPTPFLEAIDDALRSRGYSSVNSELEVFGGEPEGNIDEVEDEEVVITPKKRGRKSVE